MKQLFLVTWFALTWFAFMTATAHAEIRALEAPDFSDAAILQTSLDSVDPSCMAPQCQPPANADKFTQLEALWNQGTIPATEQVLGWYSGRCFNHASHDKTENSFLMGWTESAGGNDGPLFPGHDVLKGAVIYYYKDKSQADYFDQLSSEKEDQINTWFASEKGKMLEACVNSGSLVMGYSNARWNFRVAQGYLVMQHFEQDKVQAYCYYFRKVR